MSWRHIHGAAAHFPIALLFASLFFDLTAALFSKRRLEMRAAGFYCLALGAAGALASIATGLLLCQFNLNQEGLIASHHRFVWSSCGLMIILATCRAILDAPGGHPGRPAPSRRAIAAYLVLAAASCVLMGLAGYWGGEIVLQ